MLPPADNIKTMIKDKKKKTNDEAQPSGKLNSLVVALDIGTTKIVMVAGLLRPDGKVEVCGNSKTPSIGVEFGSVINVTDTVNSINEAKRMLEKDLNIEISQVYVGIAGRHIRSRVYSHSILRTGGNEKIVEETEIDKMTRDVEKLSYNDETIITVIPQKYIVNEIETLKPVGTLGERVEGKFQVITGFKNEIFKIGLCLQQAELKEKKIILEPMASGLACLTEEQKRQGVALIDIGGGTTDIVIFVSGVPVFTSVIPLGGQVITHDIESLGLTNEQAEMVKIKHGTCYVANANKNNNITIPSLWGGNSDNSIFSELLLAKVINARVEKDILGAVKAELIRSGYDSKIKSVILTGGGALLRDIRSLSEFVLLKKTRIGIPDTGFGCDSNLKDPTYSTALGLLKFGCLAENNISFPDPEPINEETKDEDKVNTSFAKKLTDELNKFFKILVNEKGTE